MARSMELWFRVSDTSTATESVYALLLDAGGQLFTQADVRAALHLPKTTTHVALSSLVQEGLVVEERIGRTARYAVDLSDPLTRALKTAAAVRRVQVLTAPIRDRVDLVVLFGSASRGENRSESDVDVLVVTSETDEVESVLADHPRLHPVVVTPERHMTMIAEAGTFARETSHGITIWERR